jgi:hypothetical protein
MKPPKAAPEVKLPWEISADEIAAILNGSHANPFAVLGVHQAGGVFITRCFLPGAEAVTAMTLDGTLIGDLQQIHPDGIFGGQLSITKLQPVRYRARRADAEWAVTDAYSFGPVLGPMDDYYARQGSHLRLFDKMKGQPASTLPSGRRTRSASPSSAISTIGMGAAMSCASVPTAAYGKSSRLTCRSAFPTNSRSAAMTVCFCH